MGYGDDSSITKMNLIENVSSDFCSVEEVYKYLCMEKVQERKEEDKLYNKQIVEMKKNNINYKRK